MNDKASLTALMSAFGRAYHNETADAPVFADTVARKLLTDEEFEKIGGYIVGGMDFFAPDKSNCFASEEEALRYLVNTQIAPTLLARARFCEETLKTAALTGTRQYVILGAGLDSFAFREREYIAKYPVFEVDHPLTQADKKARVARAKLPVPENLHYVPIDFSVDGFAELLRAGFDEKKKSFFSWLGVSYYLTVQQIGNMLDALSKISAEGSTLVFDYADDGLFDSNVRRVKNMVAMAAAGGEPMKSCFGYPELERLLEKYGFLIYELLTPQEIQAHYFDKCGDMTAFEHIHYVTAVFKGV